MIVCVTGLPSSGKSLACDFLIQAHFNVIKIDEYVHQIYQAKEIGYELIKDNFGKEYVNDLKVDTKKLGALVFNDDKQLTKLNNLINPVIKRKIEKLDKNKDWFVELGTYIFYHDYFKNCFDKIIFLKRDFNNKISDLKNKFCYLKKLPTFFVGNSDEDNISLQNNDLDLSFLHSSNVFIVENNGNKTFLKENILNVSYATLKDAKI